MIQRFNHIHGVGNFRDFNGGASIPFGDSTNVSVVFGRNTLGKTTMASIFESIGKDEPSYVLDRASLPTGSTSTPNIEIRYRKEDSSNGVLKFKSQKDASGQLVGGWENNDLKDKVYVFDQDFIHRHIMAGTEVTRRNREEFTDFILGEEGVKLSQEIEKDNSDLNIEKTNLPAKRPPYAIKERLDADKTEAFARMKVKESEEDLAKEKERIDKSIYRLNKVSAFHSLKPLSITSPKIGDEIKDFDAKLKISLDKSFTTVNKKAKEDLAKHIKDNCKDSALASQWIKQGLNLKSSDNCPFCGQALTGAQKLLRIYEQAFDTEFEKYDSAVKAEVSTLSFSLSSLLTGRPTNLLNTLIDDVQKYEPYVSDLSKPLGQLNDHLLNLRTFELELSTALAPYKGKISAVLDSKKASPQIAITKPDIDDALSKVTVKIDKEFEAIEKVLIILTAAVDKLKDQLKRLTNEQVNAQLALLRDELKTVEAKMARIKENSFCEAYVTAIDSIAAKTKAIKEKQLKLETDQSTYLDKYFDDLNKLFVKFGSADFELSVGTTNQGKKKIYYLKVKYRGEEVKPDQLNKVFSESDKRSLALAIYFCKVSQLGSPEKIILVLDDPVVSFDDNRINSTTSYIETKSGNFRQVIVLTHYKYLIYKLHNQMPAAYFLEIDSDASTSKLTSLDAENFTLTPHEKDFQDISEFVEGDNGKDVRKMLRPYMEQHLRLMFGKQLSDLHSDHRLSLKEVITELHGVGCFDDSMRDELHSQRTLLNPDHHTTPTDENPAATRTDARNLFKLLYEDLVIK